jgi:hypothetical protein
MHGAVNVLSDCPNLISPRRKTCVCQPATFNVLGELLDLSIRQRRTVGQITGHLEGVLGAIELTHVIQTYGRLSSCSQRHWKDAWQKDVHEKKDHNCVTDPNQNDY